MTSLNFGYYEIVMEIVSAHKDLNKSAVRQRIHFLDYLFHHEQPKRNLSI